MKGFFVTCLLFFSAALSAQEFGGHPPSQKWKQINTDTARIIFPRGLDSQANRIASVVHALAAKNNFALGNQLYKINIVLQNQTVIANGYVGLGPYRSEFYLTPSSGSFELGSLPWADQLAVHEYRHVQQFNNFRNGISKLAWHLFGEEGLLVATGAAVPNWFYEGDAVYNETMLTRQGRGRISLFLNGYKSLWLAGKDYNWMKLRNGSLKDYVPDHYQLGYLLVNYGHEKYSADFWRKVTHDASAYRGLFYPFQQAIKRYAGVPYKTFRKDAFAYYKKLNGIGEAKVIATQQAMPQGDAAGIKNITTLHKRYVTNYLFPYQSSDGELIYLKSSYRQRPAFVLRDAGGEHRIRVRDISQDDQFGYRNGRLVYTAYVPGARWGWKDYSDIRLVDVKTGAQKKVTHHQKYFSPDISEDGLRIAAVHFSAEGESELHILDANGQLMKAVKPAAGGVFTDPKWMNAESIVAGERLADGRMQLVAVNIINGNIESLAPASYNVIGYPSVKNNVVYFTAAYEGNDDLYAVRLKDRKIFKISNAALGNYFVNAGDSAILWSAFTAEGYQLQKKLLKDIQWAEVNPVAVQETMGMPAAHSNTGDFLQQVAGRSFPVKDYPKSTGLFNFHSWRPYYDPLFSFSIYGENVLNTLQTELYYAYNQNEKTNATGFNVVYGGLFPYISAGAEYTFDRTGVSGTVPRQFNQLDSKIGLNIPLNLTNGRSFNFLNVGSNYVLRNEFNTGLSKNLPANDFSYLSHFISWSQQAQMAKQHIYPKWGYALNLQHRHAVTSIKGYQFFSNGNIYLPGLTATHSLVLNGSFQQRDTLRTLFSDRFAFSRGYNEAYLSRLWKVSANYHLPLFYPDQGIGNIVYFQRVRTNLFYDFTKGYSRNKSVSRNFRSAGAELFVDTKWWNEYPLTFGIRFSHLLDEDILSPGRNANQFEFVLPVSILPK